MSKIAFFDFDGTITKKDTLFEFIKFSKGSYSFYSGLLANIHWLIFYKFRLVTNQKAKEKILSHFFKNEMINNFQTYCLNFSLKIIPTLVRPAALDQMLQLKKENYCIIIVSASLENWIKPWADNFGFITIGSKPEIVKDKLTGNLNGVNCNGLEKVNRITKLYDLSKYDDIKAYGDTQGDLPMLKLAKESYYKPFR